MTLHKQLVLMILVLFFVMFVGTFALSMKNTYNFVNSQLANHAQDTATSLGLSLSRAEQDTTIYSRMIDSVFDRGYFSTIILEDMEGTVVIEEKQEVKLPNVPQWFIQIIPLDVPQKEALVMSGWQQFGTIKVISNPAFAYEDLWLSAKHTFIWFLVSGLAALLLGFTLLHFILKPLRNICVQADAICNKEFKIEKDLPWTQDLRVVVEAMNRLAMRMKKMFESEARMTEKFRQDSYKDETTGLANKRYLLQQLDHALLNPEVHNGALLMVEVTDLKSFNEKFGYEEGDLFLRHVADEINKATVNNKQVVLAKTQGGCFTILIPYSDKESITNLSEQIVKNLISLKEKGIVEDSDIAHIGAAVFEHGEKPKDVLSRVDMALQQAQNQGPNAYHVYSFDKNVKPMGKIDWNKVLQEVIDKQKAFMYYQPIRSLHDEAKHLQHYEALLRYTDEKGQVISAGAFWPMAERLNLTSSLDKLAVSKVLKQIELTKNKLKFSVNLSVNSILDMNFIDWLREKLRHMPKVGECLIFELPEYSVVKHIDYVRNFEKTLSEFKVGLALDNFGQGFASFGYLSSLKLSYVKIDGSFVRGIDQNRDNQFYVQALAKVAQGLDLEVIAENVETEAELEFLRELHIDAAQGYFIGKPKPFDEQDVD